MGIDRRDVLPLVVVRKPGKSVPASFYDCVGESLRAVLRYRCPKCGHVAGYMTPQGIRCWWPDCRYQAPVGDLGGFVDVGG